MLREILEDREQPERFRTEYTRAQPDAPVGLFSLSKTLRRTACEIERGGVYAAPVFFRKR